MNARGLRRRTVATLLSLSIFSAHVVSFGQTDEERAAARAAATDGAKAFGEKRWADAIDLFSKAESLVHAPPHLLYLARSYEKIGKLVKAQETYSKLTHETIPADKPKVFHEAKESAIKELAALEPRIPTLKTLVEGNTAGKPVKVLVDGVEMNSALIGINRPVDPGEHKLEASTDGMASAPVTVILKEGAKESVTLTLVATATVVTPKTGPEAGTGTGTGTGPTTTTTTGGTSTGMGNEVPGPEAPSKGGGSKWLGIGLIGVGAVGLGVGTIFMLKSSSKAKEADDACGPPPCPLSTKDQVQSLDDESKSAKTLGIISLTVGGLAAVGGVIVLLTSKGSSSTAKAGPTLTPWVGVGSAGVSGSF